LSLPSLEFWKRFRGFYNRNAVKATKIPTVKTSISQPEINPIEIRMAVIKLAIAKNSNGPLRPAKT
jgi:hypothetical protein